MNRQNNWVKEINNYIIVNKPTNDVHLIVSSSRKNKKLLDATGAYDNTTIKNTAEKNTRFFFSLYVDYSIDAKKKKHG